MSLQFSIVIPVWNGAEVISQCLKALYAHPGDQPFDVICIENASRDESAQIIATRFPQVKLVCQPVNLGFAGGVNAGIRIATGEAVVLLNQDCLPQAGWLSALSAAFERHPEFGVAGCTIYFADGRVDHAGAKLTRPSAFGEHLTEVGREPRSVEYVTGAAMAIRRGVFDRIGMFDEGFYPAYYEECDFSFRAREHGFEIGYVPAARLTHLRNSHEAQADWIKHWANQQKARYRFIVKQFSASEIGEFASFETNALENEASFERAIGSVLGARDTLRALPDIIERRRIDRGADLSPEIRRQLEVAFTSILRRGFARAQLLSGSNRGRSGDRSGGGMAAQVSNLFKKAGPDREIDQLKQQVADLQTQFDRRLKVLETLADYDYR
jgi:O-antigen biosynthesis protein